MSKKKREHDLPPPALLNLYAKHFPKNRNMLLEYLSSESHLERRKEQRYWIRDIAGLAALFTCIGLSAYFFYENKPLGLVFLGVPIMGTIKSIFTHR
ncbi:hypothetical protein [Acidithiobacillus sulfurivorans]|uniref:DUF2335 domain-containing protein n=1 Tax=Acidithiobacillus sulfurivorans TaxID=1958756 RepID=A0ABS6A0S7_9PROT|nr:hypothetical protein [Acidithiobacillus sulfurivorans]MBU2761084.1 hypothetical protein [Acidithiobacillus sulfurivorans]